ncbi:PhnD/SsuA/transferrin family substrate-binding protein [Thiomicrorhabdus indica]|uniref:PhnD/SsuA/transferrin family substrate-binding protein n=1 Tax=Thiomicrorhabdus indica TaxID=2267253 RepID=UPI002AA7510A|nr:PhnD/SsuA/transferrin family substrate-binding protein [Thiomicrorhabdus indica]
MTQGFLFIQNLLVTFLASLCFLFGSSQVQAKETIYFTPLPTEDLDTLAKNNLPFIQQIEKAVNQSIRFNLKQDYSDIINGVVGQEIDLFTLGPLPYLQLKKVFPHVEPLLLMKRESGKAHYRCMLTKFRLDKPALEKPLKIALTQPMSTCGYFKTEMLLNQVLNKELSEQQYHYVGSHSGALESVLEGQFDYAGACGCFAKDYQSLGMEIIAESDYVPGFGLFANTKTVDKATIQVIKKSLLQLSSEELDRLGGIYQHGFQELEGNEYQGLSLPANIPMHGNFSP